MRPLKQRLAAKETLTLLDIKYPSPALAEAACRLGFDMVFIDCEQGSASLETVEEIARAVRGAGGCSIVRPEANFEHLVNRYLARGVDGIMAPRIESPAEASDLVRSVRRSRPADGEATIVIPMIESVQAAARLDGILAIEGIDAFFIGAGDLAHSMGFPGESGRPEVIEAVCAIAERGRRLGRAMGANLNERNAERLMASGISVAYLDIDAVLRRGKTVTEGLIRSMSPPSG